MINPEALENEAKVYHRVFGDGECTHTYWVFSRVLSDEEIKAFRYHLGEWYNGPGRGFGNLASCRKSRTRTRFFQRHGLDI